MELTNPTNNLLGSLLEQTLSPSEFQELLQSVSFSINESTETFWPSTTPNPTPITPTTPFQVTFTRQPPPTLRKGSLFTFTLSLSQPGEQSTPLTVLETSFLGHSPDSLQNGLHYQIVIQTGASPNERITSSLTIRLLDARDHSLILYEGTDRNPLNQHVLLTHAQSCTRCESGGKCGVAKSNPSAPSLVPGTSNQLSFTVRCNQNCARATGQPKATDTRRFLIEVRSSDLTPVLALSEPFCVHNSSKIKRADSELAKKKKRPRTSDDSEVPLATSSNPTSGQEPVTPIAPITPTSASGPIILAINPPTASPGETVTIVGAHLSDALAVSFGTLTPQTGHFLCSTALSVAVPDACPFGAHQVRLVGVPGSSSELLSSNWLSFTCALPLERAKDSVALAEHLQQLIPHQVDDPVALDSETILRRLQVMLG